AEYSINSDDKDATAQEFAQFMARQLGRYPGASVIVIEPSATFINNKWITGEPNWEQVLRSYSNSGTVCTISDEDGFLRIAYEKEPGRLLEESLSNGIVPPMTIVADEGAQALALWATV